MNRNQLRRRPLYVQIKSILTQRINDGEWQVDEALPSEWDLAEELSVSQGTIRRALTELVQDEVLYRQQGRGTFVAESVSDWGAALLGAPGVVGTGGAAPLVELLSCSRANASVEMAEALGLRRGESLWRLRQLWRYQGQPIAVDDAYLPCEMFEGLDARWLRQFGGGVYATLQRRYGVRVVVKSEQFRAEVLPREEASLLGQAAALDVPSLSVLRLSVSMTGEPVEWRQRYCLTQQFAYVIAQ
ncbi:MAG: GntR family transcriptional regulator [Pseudogulbenkiania sp.]|nr:GntR family transcriptional regulator [Pseudogulbenkiania sp.]